MGGAQFGNGYGKYIHEPQLSSKNLEGVLLTAETNNLLEIDLAQNYFGAVENLANSNLSSHFICSTKIEYSKELESQIISSLKMELSSLKIKSFQTILIHNWGSLGHEDRLESISFLETLMSSGLCAEVGISIYEVGELDLGEWVPHCIQAPLNFYNRDFLVSKAAMLLVAKGTKFVARSIFHQGLLLNPHLSSDLPELLIFRDFCSENDYSYLQGALSIYDSQDLFTNLVIGITSSHQLSEILKQGKIVTPSKSLPVIDSVSNKFKDPRRW